MRGGGGEEGRRAGQGWSSPSLPTTRFELLVGYSSCCVMWAPVARHSGELPAQQHQQQQYVRVEGEREGGGDRRDPMLAPLRPPAVEQQPCICRSIPNVPFQVWSPLQFLPHSCSALLYSALLCPVWHGTKPCSCPSQLIPRLSQLQLDLQLPLVLVGPGSTGSARLFADAHRLPLASLFADPSGAAYSALDLSPGFAPDLPVSPYLKLLPMLAGIGSPGTLQEARGKEGGQARVGKWGLDKGQGRRGDIKLVNMHLEVHDYGHGSRG